MGKEQLLRVTMERNTLRATTPLVSDKTAKTIIARNALYEKELSDVYKTVEKEKNHCAVSFQKSKKDLIRSSSIDLKESAEWASTKRICVLGKDSSGAVFETESRCRSSSLPTSLNLRRAKLHLSRTSSLSIENKAKQNSDRDCSSMYEGYKPHSPLTRRHAMQAVQSPDSPTSEVQFNLKCASFQTDDNKDDVFESRQRVFDAQNLGSSPTNCHTSSDVDQGIPEILVSEVENQSNESPQRKTSLTKRSYSTGDLHVALTESKNQTPSPCSSPLLRRALSSCVNSDSSPENWSEPSEMNKTKYGSLDESLLQRFNDMLMEANIPQRPKPRPKLYTEEPFYLRKKCVIRRCLQNKTDLQVKTSNPQNKGSGDQEGERPLAEILPPITLPPIYMQQNSKVKLNAMDSEKNKTKMTGVKKTNAKINVSDPRLTENLHDCRYLRNQAKR